MIETFSYIGMVATALTAFILLNKLTNKIVLKYKIYKRGKGWDAGKQYMYEQLTELEEWMGTDSSTSVLDEVVKELLLDLKMGKYTDFRKLRNRLMPVETHKRFRGTACCFGLLK